MKKRYYGLLTELQLKVLKLRLKGFSLKEIAQVFGTTRQN
ncbi:MAG: Tfx family DNA-binding protein, partial [Thermoprotei archaeon]